jgi:hypothetical protein
MGERRGTYRILLGKSEGKRPLGRSRHRWNNVKMDLQEDVGWIGLIWLRIATDDGILM